VVHKDKAKLYHGQPPVPSWLKQHVDAVKPDEEPRNTDSVVMIAINDTNPPSTTTMDAQGTLPREASVARSGSPVQEAAANESEHRDDADLSYVELPLAGRGNVLGEMNPDTVPDANHDDQNVCVPKQKCVESGVIDDVENMQGVIESGVEDDEDVTNDVTDIGCVPGDELSNADDMGCVVNSRPARSRRRPGYLNDYICV